MHSTSNSWRHKANVLTRCLRAPSNLDGSLWYVNNHMKSFIAAVSHIVRFKSDQPCSQQKNFRVVFKWSYKWTTGMGPFTKTKKEERNRNKNTPIWTGWVKQSKLSQANRYFISKSSLLIFLQSDNVSVYIATIFIFVIACKNELKPKIDDFVSNRFVFI